MGDIDYNSMVDSGGKQLIAFADSIDPSAIEAVANTWKQLSLDIPEAYQGFRNSLSSVFGSEWTGTAAESANSAADRLCQGMNTNIERVSNMYSKLQHLASAAQTVKSAAEQARAVFEAKNAKTEDRQAVARELANALHGFYGAKGEDPLGTPEPFEKVAPLVFSKPEDIFGGGDDARTKSGDGDGEGTGKGEAKEDGKGKAEGKGDEKGQGSGAGGGSPSGDGKGQGEGSGSPAGAGAGAPDAGASDFASTDPMSSELAPMDAATAAGGGIGGLGGGGGGIGDKDRKLGAAPAKAEASNKPVVNVSGPNLDGLKGQQAMGGAMGGMGGMGGAHGAGGGDGREHKTPDYLINNDHGFDLVGHALPVVSPEVIGELDKNEVKRMEANREKLMQESAQKA
ncbi:WXG100 family type VII secretion target [Segniliparus rugosus]|uniref:WXG100 family type VII secretion target n=1 Tax=Segniliparus rugosus (strain ATCC BAA-974 / DSM 45345 / CCUG 50838 / CIP 108380 / JCM 13579 / CDC 945) TaxID=679197 RepID=E5XSW4_SEGRC|nr:hypothetical protein [Segniliparus rugosus]EFV12557.1 hypothetical protein HMPREF9336_02586 [Segniliparus rugosus ATCC BAA-974]